MKSNITKTALITGASRGIGKATAEVFAAQGFSLILTCQNSMELLRSFSEQLEKKYNISCKAIQADMGCEEDVTSLFEQIASLDVLVNNAGIAHIGLLTDMTSQQ